MSCKGRLGCLLQGGAEPVHHYQRRVRGGENRLCQIHHEVLRCCRGVSTGDKRGGEGAGVQPHHGGKKGRARESEEEAQPQGGRERGRGEKREMLKSSPITEARGRGGGGKRGEGERDMAREMLKSNPIMDHWQRV